MIPTYIERLTMNWLCQKADPICRERAEEFIMKPDNSFHLVPPCIYQCGCPEDESCGYFKEFLNYAIERGMYDITNIRERYRLYNDFFKMKKGLPVESVEKQATISKPHGHMLGTTMDITIFDEIRDLREQAGKPEQPTCLMNPTDPLGQNTKKFDNHILLKQSGRYPWGHDWSAWNNEEDQNGE